MKTILRILIISFLTIFCGLVSADTGVTQKLATGGIPTDKASSSIDEAVLRKATDSKQVAKADTPLRAQGKKLFEYWCSTCHAPGIFERGLLPGTISLAIKYKGMLPAALEHREDLTGKYVKYVIRNGSEGMPFFRKTEISDTDMEAIAAYLSPNDGENSGGLASQEGRKAEEIYGSICAACHGVDMSGQVGPSLLSDTYIHGNSDSEVRKSITVGYLDKGMPGFESLLSPDEIETMVDFLKSRRTAEKK